MDFGSYRVGALEVLEQVTGQDAIVRELKTLDDRFFLEKQITLEQEQVWVVMYDAGLSTGPVPILEWRDEQGRPIPYLSSRLVDEIRKRDGAHDGLMARVLEKNRQHKEAVAEQVEEDTLEAIADVTPRLNAGHSAVLHRGAHLRRSRSKARARGENV